MEKINLVITVFLPQYELSDDFLFRFFSTSFPLHTCHLLKSYFICLLIFKCPFALWQLLKITAVAFVWVTYKLKCSSVLAVSVTLPLPRGCDCRILSLPRRVCFGESNTFWTRYPLFVEFVSHCGSVKLCKHLRLIILVIHTFLDLVRGANKKCTWYWFLFK